MLPSTGALDVSSILAARIPPTITSKIAGNAPVGLKELSIKFYDILSLKGAYSCEIRKRLDIREVCLGTHWHEEDGDREHGHPGPKQVRVVCEVDVLPDMCNAEGVLDNGCMTFLMDEGSSLAIYILDAAQGKPAHKINVSQTFNILFHVSAPLGAKIRIINRSIFGGRESGSCSSEIRDASNGRLVASGTQIVLPASKNHGRETRVARL